MVHVKLKRFLLIIGVVTCWEAERRVTTNDQTGGTLDIEQSNRTNTELQNHESRHAEPGARLAHSHQHSHHEMASPDNGLTSVSPNEGNQTSTRQTLLELNTGKTLQQKPAYTSCSPVYAKSKTAADNSSHDDKEYTLTMTSAPVYKQHNQKVQDKYLYEMWTDLFKVLNTTEQNIRLKRTRGNIPPRSDGTAIIFRAAVVRSACRCKYCNYSQITSTSQFENAAFNKLAQMSSTLGTSSRPLSPPACGAVNGVLSNTPKAGSTPRPNCFETATGDNKAWWSVDLQYVYTIATFEVAISENARSRHSLGGTDVLVDGQLCFDFYKGKSVEEIRSIFNRSGLVWKIECKKPVTGRLLLFEKRSEDNRHFGETIVFCELLLWVCKLGTYGNYPGPCRACKSECMYTCDNYWGCDKRVLHNAAVGRPVTYSSLNSGAGSFITDTVRPDDVFKCLETVNYGRRTLHWVYISLDHSYLVFYVIVSGRVDCCSNLQLNNFYVLVMPTSHGLSVPPLFYEICDLYRGGVPTRGKANITCTSPRWGKYVAVLKSDVRSLAVCEVEVFAHHRFRLIYNSDCSVASRILVCNQNSFCDAGQCRSLPGVFCIKSSSCPRDGFCDNGFCKLNFNATCDPDQANHCSRPHVCDKTLERCRLGFGSLCTPGEPSCQSIAHCDKYVGRCKWKVGQACTATSECVSGATCFNHRCACNTETSSTAGEICEPREGLVGSSCSTNDSCNGTGAWCIDMVCACTVNFTIVPEYFLCRVKPSTRCVQNTDCPGGLRCENSVCKLRNGAFCLGNEEHCLSEANCEINYCKVGNGKSCEPNISSCTLGNICFNGICRFQVGQKCTLAELCANSVCSVQDYYTCKLVAGQQCRSTYQQTATPCVSGTICEQDQVCKAEFGKTCSNTSLCVSGGECSRREGPEKKCRRALGSMNCKTDEDCGINAICDSQKQCRLAKNSSCQESQNLCLTGGLCVNDTCQCNPNVTDPQTARCDPNLKVVSGPCRVNDSCADPVALCKIGTCQCEGSFAIDHSKLICGIRPGFQCTLEKSFSSCVTGTSCIGGICVLDTGQSCVGANEGHCDIQSVCDTDHVCRLNLHQKCSGLPAHCKNGTVCDTLKRCRTKPGVYCREDTIDCMAGSHCENNTCFCTEGISTLNGSICSLNDGQVGGKCENGSCVDPLTNCINDTDLCECSPGYTPNPGSLKCVKAIGQWCQNDSECLTGTLCDPQQQKCLLSVGSMCDGENRQYCVTGSVCDTTRVCKLGLKGNCRGENRIFCKSGTFCDLLGQCSYGVNDECNYTKEGNTCVAGAVCRNFVCTCNTEVATAYGALCEPKDGRYGGGCKVSGSKCDVDNSVCEGGSCVCAPGSKPNRFFECESESKRDETGGGLLLGITFLVCLLLLIALIGLYVYTRHLRRLKKASTAVEQRRGSMHAIKELDQAVRQTQGDARQISDSSSSTAVFSSASRSEIEAPSSGIKQQVETVLLEDPEIATRV